MNENQGNQEKTLHSAMYEFNRLNEGRTMLLNEIEEIIDRIIANRQPSAQPTEAKSNSPLVKTTESFVNLLCIRIKEANWDNERLKVISNRLNELI